MVPQIGSVVPQIGSVVPQIGSVVPQIGSVVPQVRSAVPQIGSEVPQIGSVVPQNGFADLQKHLAKQRNRFLSPINRFAGRLMHSVATRNAFLMHLGGAVVAEPVVWAVWLLLPEDHFEPLKLWFACRPPLGGGGLQVEARRRTGLNYELRFTKNHNESILHY